MYDSKLKRQLYLTQDWDAACAVVEPWLTASEGVEAGTVVVPTRDRPGPCAQGWRGMSHPIDQDARTCFTADLSANYVVNANAGSGNTTAIAQRLAAMAMSPDGVDVLPKVVVVTFTRKTALEIRQPNLDERSLETLSRAFFGTIHSFCVRLVGRYGQAPRG